MRSGMKNETPAAWLSDVGQGKVLTGDKGSDLYWPGFLSNHLAVWIT